MATDLIPLQIPRPILAPPRPHTLPRSVSFLLDLVRFAAAILVVISHSGHPEFTTGFRNRQLLGDIAVPIFFVLSGFVIRFVTRSRRHTAREFFIDRASRMYSVILPAMALTLVLSAVCAHLAPAYYQATFAPFSDHALTRIILNLTFLSQSWSHSTIPFIDSPFWSLSYECLFYIVYGILFYLRGWNRFLGCIIWAALAGPQVIFLLPLWYLGSVAYDAFYALRNTRLAALISGLTLLQIASTAVLSGVMYHRWPFLFHAVIRFSLWPNPLTLFHLDPYRATMLAVGVGILASVCLLQLLLLVDFIPLQPTSIWARRFRFLADGTFAIYLMHYPLMVFAQSLGFFQLGHALVTSAILVLICLFLVILARPLDRLKDAMRQVLRSYGSSAGNLKLGRAIPAHTPKSSV